MKTVIAPVAAIALDGDRLRWMYRTMRTIREFEQRIAEAVLTGDVEGYVHLCTGQEATATGVIAALGDHDLVTSTHRPDGHAIACGMELQALACEVYGRSGGICGAKGGGMHLADVANGFAGSGGIVAANLPHSVGHALAFRHLGTPGVAVAFTGDGATNQGGFFEAIGLAALWQLPCVFVIENNGYAESTAAEYHLRGLDAAARAEAFGVPAIVADGHDVFAVHRAAEEAVARARDGGGPTVIECKVTLYRGHYEGDRETYRAPRETERAMAARDPLVGFRQQVVAGELLEASDLDAIDAEVLADVDAAIEFARSAPAPDIACVTTDVYVEWED